MMMFGEGSKEHEGTTYVTLKSYQEEEGTTHVTLKSYQEEEGMTHVTPKPCQVPIRDPKTPPSPFYVTPKPYPYTL